MFSRETDSRDVELQRDAARRAEELCTLIEGEIPSEANLRLEVTLVLPRQGEDGLRAGLRVGDRKWYVVKDIPQFLRAWRERSTLAFQSRFVYEPSWMRFSEENEKILTRLHQLFSVWGMKGWTPTQGEARLIPLPDSVAEELLEEMRGMLLRVMKPEGEVLSCPGIPEVEIPIQTECRMTPRGLQITSALPENLTPMTRSCAFAVTEEGIRCIPAHQRALVRFMEAGQNGGRCRMDFGLRDMARAVGEVLPWLKRCSTVDMSDELRAMLVRLPLEPRIYLDRDGKSVVARVTFRYGDTELNPFAHEEEKVALEKGEKLLLRDGAGEQAILDILANAGFRVTRSNIRLSQEEAIFRFLGEGVKKLGEISEVFLSREFRKMVVRRPSLRGGLKMDRGSLVMTLQVDGTPTEEVLGILEALSRSRQYYRMKDGTFLSLEGLREWQEGAAAVVEAAQRDGLQPDRDGLTLRAYRTGYLTQLLENLGLPVDAEESVREVAEELNGRRSGREAPDAGIPLRDYQRRGYEWLYMLDRLHMGGVLADEMGLGKTVQVIALMKATREAKRTSLIVAPTSLIYNWLSEIRRFAPDMSAMVINGTAAQRERMWMHLEKHGDMDVAITSYPLIRRDIEWMREIRFRFAVLDEAQNIKNAGSLVSQAARQLQADTRLALTGTPMENGIGELWSIFDFVLPGYLPGYHTFLRRYQDGMNSEQLRQRIQPFLTRRLKQDVLSELPDKMETVLTAEMTTEQRNVYLAAMERLRPKVRQAMQEKHGGRGRMEILSAITELREICCHPSLILEGYAGGSGKEEMLMELLPTLIRSGRRMLVFSQFTSMLKLLRIRMEREGYRVMYLDGETPAGDRLGITEQFNAGEGQIFLISLRAGGSGLNLTGADMVIHFDPWWNPAAEDQATDRAHRIGQQKKLDVLRLVMRDSIEEKVVELGKRKKALFDRLITPGESGLEALSEQEIRDLFE